MTGVSTDDGSRHPEAPQPEPDEPDAAPDTETPTLDPGAHPEAPQPTPDEKGRARPLSTSAR